MILLSIDTGTTKSAYVMVDTNTYKCDFTKKEECDKVDNEAMMAIVRYGYYDDSVLEMFSSYGTRVGIEVFESVVMVGRCMEASHTRGVESSRIPRRIVKEQICGKGGKISDADVRQALMDRFGGKGVKADPGFFFGIKADQWQAFALAVAYIDMKKEGVDMYA